jgi:hypothetical protein
LQTTALSAERRLVYVDSSALVKLVIEEPESRRLERHLHPEDVLATSRIALVEVPRATRIANPSPEVANETARLLASVMLIDVSDGLLRTAAHLASIAVRTLDAIHLASAIVVGADELVTYDERLATAASERGVVVSNPR